MLHSLVNRIRRDLQEDWERDQAQMWREAEPDNPSAYRQCQCQMCLEFFTPSIPWTSDDEPETFCRPECRSRYIENERLDSEYEAYAHEQRQNERELYS